MRKIFFILVFLLVAQGCTFMSINKESPPVDRGNEIILDGVTFTYKQLPVRNWKCRTDEFYLDDEGCIVMKGNSWVSNTFCESNFVVFSDLDLCAHRYVKLNSTIESITQRTSDSPSSQIHIQGVKYSSGSFDNVTKEKYSHNLKFYKGRNNRISFIDDEGIFYDSMCGNLTIGILASGGANGTAYASMRICGITAG